MKCKTCKYWGRDKKESDKTGINVGNCAQEANSLHSKTMNSNKFAMLSGHDGPIYTGEDFGCINHNQ